VPQRANVSEWFDLSPEDQIGLHLDCVRLGQCVQNAFACEKINIAALGNIVRQMHVHVVGRTTGDAAWPGPVWGHSPAIGYSDSQRDARRAALFEQPELPFTPI
jgi:diadenosine tetraphosphate (Ap4A) HIT family hydrolase